MTTQPYKLSFTAGSLLHKESVLLAELLLDTGDWDSAKKRALTQNLLQTRTLSTATRTIREVGHRLKTLSKAEIEMLVQGNHVDQAYILWVAICRYYRLIAEFAMDVVREKYLSMNYNLEEEDFDFFFNKKTEWHDELEKTEQVTRDKLKQVVFRMLREAGLLSKDGSIIPAMPTLQLVDVILRQNRQDILYFPMHEHQLSSGAPQ